MMEPGTRKRKTIALGLLPLLLPAVIWIAGHFIHESRVPAQGAPSPGGVLPQPLVVLKALAGSLAGEAHAAETASPSLVRKKLPATPPAEVTQAAPSAPPPSAAPAPSEAVPPPREPAPTPAATPSVQTPVPPAAPAVPQKPMVTTAKPETSPAEAPAASASAPAPTDASPKPEPASAPAAPKPAPPLVKPFAAAKAKPAAAEAPAQERTPKSPYSILLSSCREQENALVVLTQFHKAGFSPYIVRSEVGKKGVWWRTLMGSFHTFEEALAKINTLKLKDAVVVKIPYANQVGEFPSEKEAAQAAERLSQKGLYPYAVDGSAGPVRLVVGGFATSQAAESYRRELEAKGLATRVVRR